MSTPEAVIAGYIDHLQPETYMEEAIAAHGVPALVGQVVRVSRPRSHQLPDALAFIRDASIGVFDDAIRARFRSELGRSGLFDALETCLSLPSFAIRSQAVYTFGKLGFPETAPRLIQAFEARRERDPFLVNRLALEIRWLEGQSDSHWLRVGQLVASEGELSRWAALGVITSWTYTVTPPQAIELVDRLCADRSRLIHAEATGVAAFLAGKDPGVPPRVTFEQLERRFTDATTHADYTVDEVLAYLETVRG